MECVKCGKSMKTATELFHGFPIKGWKCPGCGEVVFGEKELQPILQYNKLRATGKGVAVKVGSLGNSTIIRVPKVAEQLYGICKGETVRLSLEPGKIVITLG